MIFRFERPSNILNRIGLLVLLFRRRLLLSGANQLELFFTDLLAELMVLSMELLILSFQADEHLACLLEESLSAFF